MDHKTDITKLWRTIKGIDGRAKRTAENEAISFNRISFSSSKQLAAKFNKQFNTSKLGIHSSSRETRLVTRETKRKPMEIEEAFTADIVTRAIKSCRNSKAFGPNKLSIFQLKNLDLERLSTSLPSSTYLSPIVRSQLYGSLHKSSLYLSLSKTPPKDLHIGQFQFSAQPRKSCWSL